jgi:uncharacterized protein YutE (UPF0331/DUF86 family)
MEGFMADDLLIIKAASIKRCVGRAREEYDKAPSTFATDLTRQDAAILNILRACAAALDMGQHLIRRERLGVPQSARDVFELLCRGGWLEASLLTTMKNMVGFRNIAVHEHQTLQLPITVAIITQHLGDFLRFSSFVLTRDAV